LALVEALPPALRSTPATLPKKPLLSLNNFVGWVEGEVEFKWRRVRALKSAVLTHQAPLAYSPHATRRRWCVSFQWAIFSLLGSVVCPGGGGRRCQRVVSHLRCPLFTMAIVLSLYCTTSSFQGRSSGAFLLLINHTKYQLLTHTNTNDNTHTNNNTHTNTNTNTKAMLARCGSLRWSHTLFFSKVLANAVIVTLIGLGKAMKWAFLGSLRDAEVEVRTAVV